MIRKRRANGSKKRNKDRTKIAVVAVVVVISNRKPVSSRQKKFLYVLYVGMEMFHRRSCISLYCNGKCLLSAFSLFVHRKACFISMMTYEKLEFLHRRSSMTPWQTCMLSLLISNADGFGTESYAFRTGEFSYLFIGSPPFLYVSIGQPLFSPPPVSVYGFMQASLKIRGRWASPTLPQIWKRKASMAICFETNLQGGVPNGRTLALARVATSSAHQPSRRHATGPAVSLSHGSPWAVKRSPLPMSLV